MIKRVDYRRLCLRERFLQKSLSTRADIACKKAQPSHKLGAATKVNNYMLRKGKII